MTTLLAYLIIDKKIDNNPTKPNIFKIKDSTVILLEQVGSNQYQPYCAGVWISNYYFLTANHCVNDSENIFYQIHTNKNNIIKKTYSVAYSGIIIKQDADKDLALILGINNNHSTVTLANDVSVGDAVWLLGHPNQLIYSLSKGIISSKKENVYDNQSSKLLQVDINLGPGNSGGGLFNNNSELLGICSFTTTNGAKFGFFADLEELKLFLTNVTY